MMHISQGYGSSYESLEGHYKDVPCEAPSSTVEAFVLNSLHLRVIGARHLRSVPQDFLFFATTLGYSSEALPCTLRPPSLVISFFNLFQLRCRPRAASLCQYAWVICFR